MIKKNDKEKILEFTSSLQHGMFATKGNPKEAMDFAYALIETLPKEHRIPAFTALHVVLNTVAAEFDRLTI